MEYPVFRINGYVEEYKICIFWSEDEFHSTKDSLSRFTGFLRGYLIRDGVYPQYVGSVKWWKVHWLTCLGPPYGAPSLLNIHKYVNMLL